MSLVTISKTMGCGSGAIGHNVAEGLDFELFDDERFRKEAVNLGISVDETVRLDEKRPGFFDRLLNHRPDQYRELMESVVYEIANRGSAVIVGHASQVLLHDFDCAFHVLCSCSEASRIKRLVAKTGMSENKASEIIEKADRERDDFMKNAYHLDWKDPTLYDLVINTDKLGGEYAARLIITMVKERISDCGLDSLDAMARLSLKKKARAALMEEGFNLNLLFLEVPEQNKIYIHGLASTLEEADNIKSALSGVKGAHEVISEISVY
jgi:cytidylate kinase